MKNDVKVSVIIPVYNMEKYMEQCLKSVAAQTLKDIEIVCINDGSSDSSPVILKRYSESDSRIKVITQKNKGVSEARNVGIRSASGKFVIFMDPDDWYPSDDVLETLYNAAEKYHVPVAGGSFMDYHDGIYNETFESRYYGYHYEKEGVIDYRDYQFDFGYQRFIFNRKLLTENNIFFKPYKRFQDPPFMVEAMIKAEKFYGINKPTYCYRYGHESVSWNKEKVCDLLQGIRDNLDISSSCQLEKLHNISVIRLNEEYRQLLGDSFFYEDYGMDVLESMMEILDHVNSDMLDAHNRSLVNIYVPVFLRIKEDIENHRQHIRNQDECIRNQRQNIEQCNERIRNLESYSEELRMERDTLEREKAAVYDSFSYKTGHFVTAPLRFCARTVRSLRKRSEGPAE